MNAPSPSRAVKKGADESKKIGEVTITFFGPRQFDIKVTGRVNTGSVQRCRRALHRAVSANKAERHRESVAALKERKAKLKAVDDAREQEERDAAEKARKAAELEAAMAIVVAAEDTDDSKTNDGKDEKPTLAETIKALNGDKPKTEEGE